MTDPDGTEIAMESFTSLSASHRDKLWACTRKMNKLKALMVDGSNVDKVDKLDTFYQVDESVQLLLSDVKENERIDWFEPKRVTFTEFWNELELWKK